MNLIKTFLISLGLLVVGLFLFKQNRNQSSVFESTQQSPTAQVRILTEQEQTSSDGEVSRHQQVVKWEREERNLDLKRMPLSISNGEATLKVEVTTKGVCFPGDTNAIEMDLRASPDHRVLMSLEELSEKGFVLSWQLPEDFLQKGKASHEFKLKVSDEPKQYGLFLCTARQGDNRCGEKPVRDINEIFTEHVRKDTNAGKETRNIFFQYLLVDNRGITAFSDFGIEGHKFEGLKKYVKDRKIQNNNFENEIDLAKKNMNTLLSLPFSFDGKTMKLELPKYNLADCAVEN